MSRSDIELHEDVFSAIGAVCFWWSATEGAILDLTLHTAQLLVKTYEDEKTRHLMKVAISHMEIRQRIATAKSFIHYAETEKSPDLYDRAEKLLNYIDNEARNERNRYVHDTWLMMGQDVERTKYQPRVTRLQARTRKLLLHSARKYNGADSIKAFVTNLSYVYEDVIALDNHLAWLSALKHETPPPAHSQPLPQEWRSLSHHDWKEPDKL